MKKRSAGVPSRQRVTLAGDEVIAYLKRLIAEGNVRRIVLRKPDGDVIMRVPLGTGIAVGAALTILAPVLAAVGAMAALVAKMQLEIIRNEDAR